MKNKITLFLLLICLISCSEDSKHVQEANRIMRNFTTYMETCEHFCLSGFGGKMMNDIQQISLSYKKQDHIGVNEARKLFVSSSKKLLNMINSDIGVRPYLNEYPFSIKNIDLSLSFSDNVGIFVPDKYIACVFSVHGNICYYVYDLAREKLMLILEEPYEESVKIVN